MNVLSLFDGISCGQIALQRAGINVDNYYASEIDKFAIKVTMANYPNTIQLGDVEKVNGIDLPKIDLLIGGSPCQGFSFAGKQLNFNDPRSKLFFEFARLKNELNPAYFLLENVKMKKEYQDVISEHLGVEPIEINSSLVSAQNRKRLYWTNIQNIEQPYDRGVLFKDICDKESINFRIVPDWKTQRRKYKKNYLQYDIFGKGYDSQDQRAFYFNKKHGTLSTKGGSQSKIIQPDGIIRHTTRNEVERLQTVPDNYTICVSENKAASLLGNGWTVDIITHIFRNIK